MPAVVVSSAALPALVRPLLGADVELVGPAAGSAARGQLLEQLATADALISLLDVTVNDELLGAGPRLKVVANCAVGFDNVNLAAATRRGVVVTNTPDVLTDATADFTLCLLLAAARRLGEGERLIRSGRWAGWAPDLLLGMELGGATLGIVGLGRIGRAVARRARGFGMHILYSGPGAAPAEVESELGARHVPLDELLVASDAVSLHCPLTPATRHLINRNTLARMKPSAILVNTARGGCVDEPALAEALAEGVIAGAGLDVFADEPRIDPRLLSAPGAVLAPHLGSATHRTRGRMAALCAEAVRDVLAGRRPAHPLNPEVLA